MSILKTTLILLFTLGSLTATSQNFVLNGSSYIGKSEKEIDKINESINSKLFHTQKVGRITSLIYYDSLNSTSHQFVFERKLYLGRVKCFSYLATMVDSSQFETAKAGLLAKCEKITPDNRIVQVSGTKKYLWHCYSSNKSNLKILSVGKYYKRRNNHNHS